MPCRPLILLLLAALLVGCDLPRDPENTLSRVRGDTLRVGIIEQPPFARYDHDQPVGVEVTLTRQLARQLDAEIQWHRGGEQRLFERLERFELDLVIGGVTDASPWAGRIGMSLPHFVEHDGPRTRKHVFATPPGENAWLAVVDRFAYDHRVQSARLYASEVNP